MNKIHLATPGEILKLEFLEAYKITAYRLATDTGMTHTRVSQIIRGTRGITLDTAMRLGRYFGTSVAFWVNLQTQYDIRTVDSGVTKEINDIVPIHSTARTKRSVHTSAILSSRPILRPA
jgi:addiction module HigA family antidote